MAKQGQETKQLSLISEDDIKAIIRPEENIEKWSHFLFPQPKTLGLDKPRGIEWDVKLPDGEKGAASIRVEPSTAHDSPTCRTYDVYLAIIEIWGKRNKPTSSFFTSMSEICKELGYKKGGSTIKIIEDELSKLLKTNISWTLAYKQDREHCTVKNQSILVTYSYSNMAERADKSDKFNKQCELQFHDSILKNLLDNRTIPVNFAARKLITSPIAKVLYNQVDTFLASSNRPYSRTGINLVEDLHLTPGRYKYKSQREKLLEGLHKNLHGRRLGNHKVLNVKVSKTVDEKDYKLTFTASKNLKKETTVTKRPNLVVAEKDPIKIDWLIKNIADIVGHEKENHGLYKMFAKHYGENAIQRALGEFKENSRNGGKKPSPQMFTAILHRVIHDMGFDNWIKECTPNKENCKYRADLFSMSDQ